MGTGGPQGHSGAQLWQRRREGGQGRARTRRRSAAEGRRRCVPTTCSSGSAARADWQECRPGTGSSRCPSPVKPRQQLRVLCERAEQPREPSRASVGRRRPAVRPHSVPAGGRKALGSDFPAREPADTRCLGPFLTRVRRVTLDCTVSPASISHLHTERVGQAPARGRPTAFGACQPGRAERQGTPFLGPRWEPMGAAVF